jgi:hypothetical protein
MCKLLFTTLYSTDVFGIRSASQQQLVSHHKRKSGCFMFFFSVLCNCHRAVEMVRQEHDPIVI